MTEELNFSFIIRFGKPPLASSYLIGQCGSGADRFLFLLTGRRICGKRDQGPSVLYYFLPSLPIVTSIIFLLLEYI